MNFLETFPECSLPSTVSKNTIQLVGHHARIRDVTDQSCPISKSTPVLVLITRVIYRSKQGGKGRAVKRAVRSWADM